jgi:predicted PurR-regulated permease PerM
MSEKNIESTDLTVEQIEFLRQFSRENKKAIRHRRIIAYAEVAILGLLVISFFIVVPRLVKVIDSMNETLTRVNAITDKFEPVLNELNEIDYDGLSESVNKLNGAVEDLSQFTQRISGITSIFGRN